MVKTSWLELLRTRLPEIHFVKSDSFRWSPTDATVYTGELENEHDLITLLHETGHAIAQHTTYEQDIRLLKLEREAWEIARRELAPVFGITITDDVIEEALDSYRDWIHERSRCPACNSHGVQRDEQHYCCLVCNVTWRVNDARTCRLKRLITDHHSSYTK